MRIYIFHLFLFTSSVFCFTLDQVIERVDHIEERVNKESKFRRDGFKTLMNEIGSIKTMLQQALENKVETENVQDTKYTNSELEEKVLLLTNAFMKEKMLNKRIRREIPELQQQVQDLKTKSDQIFTGVEDTLREMQFIKKQNIERQETFIMLKGEIPEIKGYALNLLEQFEQTEITEADNLGKIKHDTEEIKKNIEHMKRSGDQCLETIKINNNITKRIEEQLVSGNSFPKTGNDSKRSEVYDKECNCSISSCPVNSTTPSSKDTVTFYKSCSELSDNGVIANGIYKVEIEDKGKVSVYCDMTIDGGGWTVFQRRQDGSVNFSRNWYDYETGFGNLSGEFWLGNKYLNMLTDDEDPHELRIELEDHHSNRAYAKYSRFKVGSRRANYKLEVSGYVGNAGDSLAKTALYGPHDQMEFSTRDADNDKDMTGNCAEEWGGGWWFRKCFDSNLNGPYMAQSECEVEWKCIIWYTWKSRDKSMKFTEMKLR